MKICLVFLSVLSVALPQNTYESLNAVLWTQSSAEFKAASMQTYRAAEYQLNRALKDPNWTAALEQSGDFSKLPPAVILDLDETVLDNSGMHARLITEGRTYSEQEWTIWIKEQRGGVLEGALDFLKVAHANGVAIFYITNRVCDPARSDDPTLAVLRNSSIPFRTDRLLCRSETPDKSPRRASVARGHRVLLLIGDDFNDFVSVPQQQSTIAGRIAIALANRRYWGERWFVMPNPMYGSWERVSGPEVKKKLEALRP